METKVIRISRDNPQPDALKEAADVIRRGGLVAFPTETVYGLGANALDKEAVRKIFEAKKRPADDPLIAHIANPGDLKRLSSDLPEEAEKLAEKFWPGPLTMIVRKNPIVPDEATAGTDTVAVRMPKNSIALELIRFAGFPVAAPSANLFGHTSPTNAEHVLADLSGRIDMVIDGGPTEVGVESTVIDLTSDNPTILRPGGITLEKIREVLPGAEMPGTVNNPNGGEAKKSPGLHSRHYAPDRAELVLVEGDPYSITGKIGQLAEEYSIQGKSVAVMASREVSEGYDGPGKTFVLGSREDLSTIARNLFKILREADDSGADIILAEGFAENGIGAAIMNRLRRAAEKSI